VPRSSERVTARADLGSIEKAKGGKRSLQLSTTARVLSVDPLSATMISQSPANVCFELRADPFLAIEDRQDHRDPHEGLAHMIGWFPPTIVAA
jgi:hypothetical protein